MTEMKTLKMRELERIKLFERLLKMDEIIAEAIQMVGNHLYDVNGDLKDVIKRIDVAGSVAEGCMLARFFYPCEDFEDKINFELEADIDLVLNFEDIDEKCITINDIEGKPGYVSVEAGENTSPINNKWKACLQESWVSESIPDRVELLKRLRSSNFVKTFFSTSRNESSKSFLDSDKVKNVLLEFYDGTRAVESMHGTLRKASRAAEQLSQISSPVQSLVEGLQCFGPIFEGLGETSSPMQSFFDGMNEMAATAQGLVKTFGALKNINIADPRQNLRETKSSLETSLDIKLCDKLVGRFSYDSVIVLKAKQWSDYSKEQAESYERRWAEMGVLDGLNTEAYLLLTKSHRDDSCAIRVSLSQIERSLCQRRSPNQKLVYFIFKSMFYKHIKVLNKPGDSTISSFLGKNVMFWVLHENTDNFSDYVSQKNIVEALRILFRRLKDMITNGDAPYYLISTNNIVDTMPREMRRALSERIETILANIDDHIPSIQDVKNVTSKLERLGELSKGFAQVLNYVNGETNVEDLGGRVIIEHFLSSGLVYKIIGKLADVK